MDLEHHSVFRLQCEERTWTRNDISNTGTSSPPFSMAGKGWIWSLVGGEWI